MLAVALSALLAFAAPAFAGRDQHSGEILGVHAGKRTLTLRIIGSEGKEVLVFFVSEDTSIRQEESDHPLRFEDLKPGARATIRSHREGSRRLATEIMVRKAARSGT
jgi:hypothetical protein